MPVAVMRWIRATTRRRHGSLWLQYLSLGTWRNAVFAPTAATQYVNLVSVADPDMVCVCMLQYALGQKTMFLHGSPCFSVRNYSVQGLLYNPDVNP